MNRIILIMYIVLLILIFVFIIYTAFTPINGHLDRIGNKLTLLGIFLIGFGIYLTYLNYVNTDINIRRTYTLKFSQENWVAINDKISNLYDRCPDFCNTLYYDWQISQLGVTKNGVNDWVAVNSISNSIFQTWENVYQNIDIYQTYSYVWLCNFLQWSNSMQLYQIWETMKSNYTIDTIVFGDLLFKTSQANKPKNSFELQQLGIQLCCEINKTNPLFKCDNC